MKILLLIMLLCFHSLAGANGAGEKRHDPKALPRFSLTDHQGHAFDQQRLRDHWSLVFLGFTTCPHVCPMTLRSLEAVRAELGLRVMPDHLPQIVFLAVDPARDRSVLGKYLKNFHGEFIGATGDHENLQNLVSALGGYYRLDKNSPDDTSYDVVHSSGVAVVNAQGEWVATINPPFRARDTSNFLYRVIKQIDL